MFRVCPRWADHSNGAGLEKGIPRVFQTEGLSVASEATANPLIYSSLIFFREFGKLQSVVGTFFSSFGTWNELFLVLAETIRWVVALYQSHHRWGKFLASGSAQARTPETQKSSETSTLRQARVRVREQKQARSHAEAAPYPPPCDCWA